ncbi:MAG: 3-deoxy-7-phosphoheptulonate synthase [Armatimonadetes bacterium]|nr:3-deoxy-7-phosphoheptulonate synthase [Armatimonadota bacterium]
MIIIMEPGASAEQVHDVEEEIRRIGLRPFLNPGVERKVIAVLGEVDVTKAALVGHFSMYAGVARVELISDLWKLCSRGYHPENSIVQVGDVAFGAEKIVVIAGPCSVESREQTLEIAEQVKEMGASLLRGGAFKPRSSPYSFQGLGEQGLKFLAEARERTGLPVVTEVMDTHEIVLVAEYADVLQIGARNMQNYSLLKAVGHSGRAVLLKRGMGSRVKDLLMSAEYILSEGNPDVILCERGITTFEDSTRNTTDINAIPVLKHWTHLPVVLDPSHSTGVWRYVAPVACAGVACGADGIIVEVHNDPQRAMSDGMQSLKYDNFKSLMSQVGRIAEAVGRTS